MDQISFQYPAWYLLFCVLAALCYALLLYWRDQRFREVAPRLHVWLGLLRFLAVFLVTLLLLEPLIKSVVTEVKKPIVVVAQDVSESVAMALRADTAALRTDLEALRARLADRYEVATFSFGQAVRPGLDAPFADKATNLDALFRELYDRYAGQNLGAVIVATDGIYNRGANPLYTGRQLGAPLYAIALGDTVPEKDLLIKQVFFNKIVYLGDQFVVQVDVAAHHCDGERATLSVQQIEGGQARTLQQVPVRVQGDDFFTTVEVTLEARQAGVQRYRFSLSRLTDEVSTANNTRDVFVEVLDARQKILLLAHAPHPDLAAIRRALEQRKNYEVAVAFADQPIDVAAYDFVVLHQLPSRKYPIQGLLAQMDARKTPRLFIVGAQTDLARFNEAQALLTIRGNGGQVNDVTAWVQPDFDLFTWDERLAAELKVWPPLQAPFGEYGLGDAEVLLWQRIGKVDTQYPLWAFGEPSGVRTGVLTAEGLWRWRLFEYLQHQNHELTDGLLAKAVQYLSVKEDKRRFRVRVTKNIFDENERIVFDGELYNPSYELVNEPDVTLTVRDENGREYTWVMDKTEKAYRLDAGILPVGSYTFSARVQYGGEMLTATGRFSVQPVQLEAFATTADHALLRRLAEEYGGQLLYPDQIDEIPALLEQSGKVKPVAYASTRTQGLLHHKWLFFLILGLLSLEWFLRRYFGSY